MLGTGYMHPGAIAVGEGSAGKARYRRAATDCLVATLLSTRALTPCGMRDGWTRRYQARMAPISAVKDSPVALGQLGSPKSAGGWHDGQHCLLRPGHILL